MDQPIRTGRKPRVLFVGAFQPPPGSAIRGGQLAACRAILESPLSGHIDWVLLESTMESIPPPPLARRAWLASQRCLRFAGRLLGSRIDAVLIFTSSELSLVEKGCMAILARLAGKRVVLCPRSGFLLREYRARWFARWWLRLVLRCSDRIVCQGRGWREFFVAVSDLPVERFPIIYNIISASTFMPSPLPQREIAECAVLMGWVEKNKGIFDLVEVVDRFRPELAGMRFVICGRGQDYERLKSDLQRRNLESYFELRGWVDEVGKQKALAEADFSLMLSHREGMPNALLEAMAAARPVVATAVGAVADVVEEGQNGFLCEPRDVDEIGFRILDLRRDRALRERMGTRARQTVLEHLDSEVLWRKWLEALGGAPSTPEGDS